MKRILILLLAVIPFIGQAQPFSTTISGFRTYNNSNITSKTASHSITPINVGGNIDSLASLLGSAFDSISNAGNLQGVTGIGNSTTHGIIASSVSSGSIVEIDSQEVQVESPIVAGSGTVLSVLPNQLRYKQLTGAGSKVGFLTFATLTGNHTWYMPDESVTGTQDNWVMLHNSIHPLLVGTGTLGTPTTGVLIDGLPEVSLIYSGTVYGRFKWNGTQAALSLADAASPNTSDIIAGTLTAARTATLPDYSGTFLFNVGGSATQSLSGATSMTIPHGASFTPSRCSITPRNGVAAGAWTSAWVSSITSTNIVISFATPITGVCNFDFQVYP